MLENSVTSKQRSLFPIFQNGFHYSKGKIRFIIWNKMSELDEQRQDYILNHLSGRQVFITCCDKNSIDRMRRGKAFEIKDGEIFDDNE